MTKKTFIRVMLLILLITGSFVIGSAPARQPQEEICSEAGESSSEIKPRSDLMFFESISRHLLNIK